MSNFCCKSCGGGGGAPSDSQPNATGSPSSRSRCMLVRDAKACVSKGVEAHGSAGSLVKEGCAWNQTASTCVSYCNTLSKAGKNKCKPSGTSKCWWDPMDNHCDGGLDMSCAAYALAGMMGTKGHACHGMDWQGSGPSCACWTALLKSKEAAKCGAQQKQFLMTFKSQTCNSSSSSTMGIYPTSADCTGYRVSQQAQAPCADIGRLLQAQGYRAVKGKAGCYSLRSASIQVCGSTSSAGSGGSSSGNSSSRQQQCSACSRQFQQNRGCYAVAAQKNFSSLVPSNCMSCAKELVSSCLQQLGGRRRLQNSNSVAARVNASRCAAIKSRIDSIKGYFNPQSCCACVKRYALDGGCLSRGTNGELKKAPHRGCEMCGASALWTCRAFYASPSPPPTSSSSSSSSQLERLTCVADAVAPMLMQKNNPCSADDFTQAVPGCKCITALARSQAAKRCDVVQRSQLELLQRSACTNLTSLCSSSVARACVQRCTPCVPW